MADEKNNVATFLEGDHRSKSSLDGTLQQIPDKDRKERLGKVISGKVSIKKKPLSKRFVETFLGDDIGNIGDYIVHDVLIPTAKETLTSIVSGLGGSIEMLIWGDNYRGNRNSKYGGSQSSYVSYNNYSNTRQLPKPTDRTNKASINRARHNFDDIVFDSKGEAQEVLSLMFTATRDYGMVSVADLYDMVGITSTFTDNKWGWTELGTATVERVRGGGYILQMPRPKTLD